MTNTAQVCGNRKWFRDSGFSSGGNCEFPLPYWVHVMANRLHGAAFPCEILGPQSVRQDEGKDCPTWTHK